MCRWSKVPPIAEVRYRGAAGEPVAEVNAPSSRLAEGREAKSSDVALPFPLPGPAPPSASIVVLLGHSHRSTVCSSALDGKQMPVPRNSSTTTFTFASSRSCSRYARVAAL